MEFEQAVKHTLQFEGGYVHDPDDRGGETFRGISRRAWPAWPGWEDIDRAKSLGNRTRKSIDSYFAGDQSISRKVADFYRANFWQPFASFGLPGRLTAKLFDTAVNTGVKGAVKLAQKSANLLALSPPLKVDGAAGAKTLAAISAAIGGNPGEDGFLAAFVKVQEDNYRRLAARPGQSKFLKGWLRRAAWLPPADKPSLA